MPRSPRATMMPSVLLRMASKFSRPCWFSILAMIYTLMYGAKEKVAGNECVPLIVFRGRYREGSTLMFLPASPRTARILSISCAVLTKLAAMKSTPCLTCRKRWKKVELSKKKCREGNKEWRAYPEVSEVVLVSLGHGREVHDTARKIHVFIIPK